jgi:hypothetical protein
MSNDNIGGGPPQAPSSAETVSGEGSGHTPGPWRVLPTPFCDRIEAENGPCIAETGNWLAHEKVEQHANARLIAAAPDLLEALKELRVREWGHGPSTDPLYARVRDAIAKAEGHSQADAGRPTQPREEQA